MKKLLALISLSLALVGGASAASYSDVNHANVRLDANAGGYFGPFWIPNALYNPTYTGTFTLAGYDPTAEYITSASATFDLYDILGKESYQVVINDISIVGGSFIWDLSFGTGIFGAALMDLSEDGILSYSVTATSGSFWLNTASITAESAEIVLDAPSVPETSATFALMGVALLGLAGVKRKLRA